MYKLKNLIDGPLSVHIREDKSIHFKSKGTLDVNDDDMKSPELKAKIKRNAIMVIGEIKTQEQKTKLKK